MVFSILKNWNRRCSSHYIIKFVDFMSIYYAINLDIVTPQNRAGCPLTTHQPAETLVNVR